MAVSIRKIENKTKLDSILIRNFTNTFRVGYVEAGDDNVCLPVYYKEHEERIRNFKIRDDDIFVTGIAKSGTTWCHEMVWLIINNLDYEAAQVKTIVRCPLLETAILYDFNIMEFNELGENDPLSYIEKLQSPRCIKSHLHWSLLPLQIRDGSKQPKMISIFRDAKDTCVSHYHEARSTAGYKGTFEEFSELYLGGRVPYGPYWKYVLSFWQQRHRSNILFVKYKDMKADFPSVIKKVANFLEKPLTEDQIGKLADHLSLASMKNNPAINDKEKLEKLDKYNLTIAKTEFIRTGTVGDYASMMTPEISAKFDAWTADNLAGTDFGF